ncbi:MAG: hypothetical protein QXX08_05980 [Candidatus Bathyarchaeia archaeon]
MRCRAKTAIALLLVTQIIAISYLQVFFNNVNATTYEVGVKVGHWAKYTLSIDWNSAPPRPEPPETMHLRQIDYYIYRVKEIYDTYVILEETAYFKNNTRKTRIYAGDVRTGEGNLSLQVIAKNLNPGDKLFELSDAPSINITTQERYAGATRKVNVINIEAGVLGLGNWTMIELQWDKETGFLCKSAILKTVYMENYTVSVTSYERWVMVETNLWQPETFPIWLPLSVIVGVLIVSYIIIKKLFRKRLPVKTIKKRHHEK